MFKEARIFDKDKINSSKCFYLRIKNKDLYGIVLFTSAIRINLLISFRSMDDFKELRDLVKEMDCKSFFSVIHPSETYMNHEKRVDISNTVYILNLLIEDINADKIDIKKLRVVEN